MSVRLLSVGPFCFPLSAPRSVRRIASCRALSSVGRPADFWLSISDLSASLAIFVLDRVAGAPSIALTASAVPQSVPLLSALFPSVVRRTCSCGGAVRSVTGFCRAESPLGVPLRTSVVSLPASKSSPKRTASPPDKVPAALPTKLGVLSFLGHEPATVAPGVPAQ